MSLVYSTLFALVPVVAVAFSVLKAFGYHRELEPVLYEFLRPLGEKGSELTAKIMEFVENVQSTLLGTVGFVFLLYTVIVDDPEDRGRAQLHLARRAAAQPRAARDRVRRRHARRARSLTVVAMVMLASYRGQRQWWRRLSGLATGTPAAARSHFAPYVLIIGAVLVPVRLHAEHARAAGVPAFVGALFGGAAVGRRSARSSRASSSTRRRRRRSTPASRSCCCSWCGCT